jgi:hypothetical protein
MAFKVVQLSRVQHGQPDVPGGDNVEDGRLCPGCHAKILPLNIGRSFSRILPHPFSYWVVCGFFFGLQFPSVVLFLRPLQSSEHAELSFTQRLLPLPFFTCHVAGLFVD